MKGRDNSCKILIVTLSTLFPKSKKNKYFPKHFYEGSIILLLTLKHYYESKIVEYFNHDHGYNNLNQNTRKISPSMHKSEKYNNQVDLYQ